MGGSYFFCSLLAESLLHGGLMDLSTPLILTEFCYHSPICIFKPKIVTAWMFVGPTSMQCPLCGAATHTPFKNSFYNKSSSK